MQELTAELEKGKSITDFASSAGLFAEFYFYLGDVERGKEASYLFSQHCEELVAGNLSRENIISFLFRAGLYRSLAQAPTEAEALWIRFIETRRQWFPDRIIALGKNKRLVRSWIQEAYALVKLNQFEESILYSKKGFQALLEGKGFYPEPRENVLEYGLVEVIQALAHYQQDPQPTNQARIQQALTNYKAENLAYGRLGYPVIFDLQFSYPHIITPVLPGSDRNLD